MSLITRLNGCTGKSPDEIVKLLNNNGWTPAPHITEEFYNANGPVRYIWLRWLDNRWCVAGSSSPLHTLGYDSILNSQYMLKPRKDYDLDEQYPPNPSRETAIRWNAGYFP